MRQRFVPELQSLRVGPPYTVAAITFPEIEAALSFPPGSKSVLGLTVFVGAKGAGGGYEHTDIVFDLSLNQVQVDRRGSSSNGTDNDVRAASLTLSIHHF